MTLGPHERVYTVRDESFEVARDQEARHVLTEDAALLAVAGGSGKPKFDTHDNLPAHKPQCLRRLCASAPTIAQYGTQAVRLMDGQGK
jgi:putative intracellular protease/amidase